MVLLHAQNKSTIKSEIILNKQLAEELNKPIIRKLKKKQEIHSSVKENIWGADLADTQLISKYNKGFRFLLCANDIFSKYAWDGSLKNKNGIAIADTFQVILDEYNYKSNKIWVDKGTEIYNRSMKSWL